MLKLLVLKLVFRKFVKMMTTMTILKDMILIPYTAERRDVLGPIYFTRPERPKPEGHLEDRGKS